MSFDPRPYARRILKENAAEKEKIRERRTLALAEANRLGAAIMAADPSVRRVILFGSLAEGMPKKAKFDIDLALDGGDLYAAMDIAETSPFEVDIVNLERLPEHMKKRVLERGRALPVGEQ